MINSSKKKIIVVSIILLFVVITLGPKPLVANNKLSISSDTFYVGGTGEGNFSKIQDAIDNTTDFDTVFVYSGTYVENIVIKTSIMLIGQNKYDTIIDASRKDDAIKVFSENTKITNFCLVNASGKGILNEFRAAINLTKSNNFVYENIFKEDNVGVFILRSTNNTIVDNEFYNCSILPSAYTVIENHVPIDNKYFIHNIKNNTFNSKKIYYFKNEKNFVVPKDAGVLITYNCSNLTIEDLHFTKCGFGFLLTYTKKCKILNSSFIDDADVWITKSCHNYFYNNTMKKNFHGITLDYGSCKNKFISNNFSENQLMGVMLEKFSNDNLFVKNNLMNNNKTYGNAYIQQCFRNKWKHNYYDDWIGLKYPILGCFPKIIIGVLFENIKGLPNVNFDWQPAHKPYDI